MGWKVMVGNILLAAGDGEGGGFFSMWKGMEELMILF
jgi:hypothetical protein